MRDFEIVLRLEDLFHYTLQAELESHSKSKGVCERFLLSGT